MTAVATEMTLGDRMKGYEKTARTYLPRKTFTVIRMDGRGFSKFTRQMDKPFDMGFLDVMDRVTEALCAEVAGTRIAYTQSDEISLILSDHGDRTEPWLGGQVQKLVSITAGLATAHFNHLGPDSWFTNGPAVFDSRVFTLDSKAEVKNYLLWRQRDARRNAISMQARHHFSHKTLHGKTMGERLDMLTTGGVTPVTGRVFEGAVVYRDMFEVEGFDGPVMRHRWVTETAPAENIGDWLDDTDFLTVA
ncbi:tRNA(His) guanylyltransferase Thg1 family protein [Aeromicrobium sp. 179-A 4D2 NHS]|uniref:tRNA(His) guanylyltransferase Thg1 family protein n=1 Tax=Aeromicrobium sp. 179-A 4D2 NHS TaxID=3142375 RepID=UPI0039A2FBF0